MKTSTPQFRSLDRQERAGLRSILFRHLDGYSIAPTIMGLKRHGVLGLFDSSQTVGLDRIVDHTGGSEGYLQVAMRLLCSQGWLVQSVNSRTDTIKYTITNRTQHAFQFADTYAEMVSYLPVAAAMDDYLFGDLEVEPEQELISVVERQRLRWDLAATGDPDVDVVQKQILLHLEGMLVGPILVALGMRGLLDRYTENQRCIATGDFEGNEERLSAVLELFTDLGWVEQGARELKLSPKGLFYTRRASAYGVTVSYLPMFQRVEELLFGNPNVLWEIKPGEPEIHVNRAMNVWGSGGAHSTYFKKVDEIIVEIFSRPIEEQPLGIADMGCGNGAFLAHIFDVIWEKSERGRMLDSHPLFIVGSDFNQAALEVAKETLARADVWANVIFGDIGNPSKFAADLKRDYGIALGDLLSVRSFLDHNRQYKDPDHIDPGRESRSTGAFSYRGRRITNNAIEQNLVDHLRSWAPLVKRFGLLVLELHTIPPKMAALNIGNTNVTAYDGTHGYSDQYILEFEVFLNAAREAGLSPDPRFQARYPASDLATITVNLLREG